MAKPMKVGGLYVVTGFRTEAGARNIGKVVTFERWIFHNDGLPDGGVYRGDPPTCLVSGEGLYSTRYVRLKSTGQRVGTRIVCGGFALTASHNLTPLEDWGKQIDCLEEAEVPAGKEDVMR